MVLSLDFETFSATDLLKHGVYRYVADPRFDPICASYAIDDGPIRTWWPGMPLPECFKTATRINAWNAAFERLVWHSEAAKRYGFPPRPITDFRCTAARARAFGAPGALDKAARFFGLRLEKDFAGQAVLRRYWAPTDSGQRLIPQGEDRAVIQKYCEVDVLLESQLASILPDLSPAEREVYCVNEEINDRGMAVDRALLDAGRASIERAESYFGEELSRITVGAVASPRQTARILDWLDALGNPLPDLTDDTVSSALDSPDTLHPLALKLLTLRQDGAYAAIGKYEAIHNRLSSDGRLRGAFVYCGAVATGRFSSFGVQLHNMRRDLPEDPQEYAGLIAKCRSGNASYEDLARCVRGLFVGDLQIGDYSQIEARGLPWLAKDARARQRMMLFEMGVDLYPITASQIYRCGVKEIDAYRRQIGKVAELALGYQGGAGALGKMAGSYGITIPEEERERIKRAWRGANPWAVGFWKALENAAFTAVTTGRGEAGRVHFVSRGNVLQMVLPSGRALTYHAVAVEEGRYGPQLTCLWPSRPPKKGAAGWPRRGLYGGLFAENATQASMRDVLCAALVGTSNAVLHVHDEIVVDGSRTDLKAVMLESRPDWADGLPVAAKVHNAVRYGKA